MDEEWRDIPGYEGRYQVSDLGRVRSVDRYIKHGRWNPGDMRLMKGKILSPGRPRRETRSYFHVNLGLGNCAFVHVLVAAAFIGPKPPGTEVCHWNGDCGDNRWPNIIYDTRQANHEHKLGQGKCRISEADAVLLKRARNYAESCALAARFGISITYANHIRQGRTLQHFDPDEFERRSQL